MIIHPEIIVTPDQPTIRFKEPRDQINLDEELPRILHGQGWGCGTFFRVQFLNHEKTALLSSALFVVSEEVESLHTSDANPYQPMTRTVFSRRAEIVGDWWVSSIKDERDEVAGGRRPNLDGPLIIKWNPGKGAHEARVGDKVLYADSDKKKVLAFIEGETAKVA